MEETIAIVVELGIKRPANPKIGEPIERTTGFLLTININNKLGNLARTLNYKDELMSEHV